MPQQRLHGSKIMRPKLREGRVKRDREYFDFKSPKFYREKSFYAKQQYRAILLCFKATAIILNANFTNFTEF